MPDQINYNNWTKLGLIQRVRELESQLKASSQPLPSLPAAAPEEPCEKAEEPKESAGSAAALTSDDGLKKQGDAKSSPDAAVKKPKIKRKIDPSRYSTRYIALKFAYLGKNYGGFEFQAEGNQPSIEEELWNALTKSCLIFPEDEKIVDFGCCEYSKCGRTDRGVSAFGQVVGLRVRSNRPLPKKRLKLDENRDAGAPLEVKSDEGKDQEEEEDPSFNPIADEIQYPHILNRILPKDIRILAWCPSPPPDFSARFSCRERQYRYFFTQPAFAPTPSHIEGPLPRAGMAKPGWLNIEAMRDAAKRYEGEHDFRNLCKIDPAKQITNFHRRIFESDIVEVKDAGLALPYLQANGFLPEALQKNINDKDGVDRFSKVYYFHVRGSAFLWHQIRHMVAILFLVGQGLESPSLVSELLDVEKNPRRPNYVMADEVPLVLWDCIFPSDLNDTTATSRVDSLQWVYVGDEAASASASAGGKRHGQFGVMEDAWQIWREKKMDEVLAGQLLQHIAQQDGSASQGSSSITNASNSHSSSSIKVFEGGNSGRMGGKYSGVMKMKLLDSADEQNDKYAKRKGYANAEDMRRSKGMS